MTKKEIYEKVVRLTSKLCKTQIPKKIFYEARVENAKNIDLIINAFPQYHPKLYREIICFGKKFNKLVGDSPENNEKRERILQDGEILMYELGRTKIIDCINDAVEKKDAQKVLKIIQEFKTKDFPFVNNLINFQNDCNNFWESQKTGQEGAIFSNKTDEENSIFEFDTNIIDVESFYVLLIMANILDIHFFKLYCDGNDEVIGAPGKDLYVEAIQEATNDYFAEFVECYNFVDWIGDDEDDYTPGELLVAAFTGQFE